MNINFDDNGNIIIDNLSQAEQIIFNCIHNMSVRDNKLIFKLVEGCDINNPSYMASKEEKLTGLASIYAEAKSHNINKAEADSIIEMIKDGFKLNAVKLIKEKTTTLGLKESKELMDKWSAIIHLI